MRSPSKRATPSTLATRDVDAPPMMRSSTAMNAPATRSSAKSSGSPPSLRKAAPLSSLTTASSVRRSCQTRCSTSG
eukprot:6229199-Prymnesium_polylepis.1